MKYKVCNFLLKITFLINTFDFVVYPRMEALHETVILVFCSTEQVQARRKLQFISNQLQIKIADCNPTIKKAECH